MALFLHLAWQGAGRFAPLPPVSYAPDQVHFKHEQPQVLLIESHVTSAGFRVGEARGKTKEGSSDDVITISQP